MDIIQAHELDPNGVIVNTINVLSLDDFPNLVDASIGGTFGDRVVDGVLIPKESVPPTPPELVIPDEVSRRRGLQALFILYGLTDVDIEERIKEVLKGNPAQLYLALTEFKTSQTFERNRALVVMMAHMLDLDLNALFLKAGQIP